MGRKYFGTDGIRGHVGKFPITPDFFLRFGYSVGRALNKIHEAPSVVIGKDTRLSGYLFESSLESGFSYAGVDVHLVGPMPTPAIAYLTRKHNLSGGVVISASHNPYTDNGLKLFSNNGTKLPDTFELEVERLLSTDMEMATHLGKAFRLEEAHDEYVEFCKSTFLHSENLSGMKIVLDCANGATYQMAPQIFNMLGAEVITIGCEPNGVNINDGCGSLYPEQLIKTVINENADIGIAFDGDGDRVLFVDSKGKLYNGDHLIYIIFKAYAANNNNSPGVVGTVMTNLAMEHALNKQGFELVRTNVGDRYILEELNKRGWNVGGEASGHIICLDKHTTGDGIIAALQVLSAIKMFDQPLNELVDWFEYPQVMINVECDNTIKNKFQWVCESVVEDAKVALGSDGRVIVRKSGTEPVVRVMVEAACVKSAENWAHKIADQLR